MIGLANYWMVKLSAICVNNLCKNFHEIVAVDKLSFEIPYGEVTALLGSNGAGKSTTLNMLAGILLPTAGEILFNGQSFESDYREIKKLLGYLTCDMSLYDNLTIYENLKFLADLKGVGQEETKKNIKRLSEQFNLTPLWNKYFKELSSGQKQRSLVAAAVVHDPKILIFDEVTASLDLIVSKYIMDFLIEEKKKGKAIIFSTHILSEVEYISDRILMIEKGKLVKETTTEELIETYKAPNITQAFYEALVEQQQAHQND
jgi:sodium transport system ATP-binding protein